MRQLLQPYHMNPKVWCAYPLNGRNGQREAVERIVTHRTLRTEMDVLLGSIYKVFIKVCLIIYNHTHTNKSITPLFLEKTTPSGVS